METTDIQNKVALIPYPELHQVMKGENKALDKPKPDIAIPVANPLCLENHNIHGLTGDK